MTLAELVRLGVGVLIDKARNGELRHEHLWTAMKGAAKYRAAVAAGDVCDPETAQDRAERCVGCPSMTTDASDLDGVLRHWCGPAMEDHGESVLATCGCLVALTVCGRVVAGAKAAVGSERCPQGRW